MRRRSGRTSSGRRATPYRRCRTSTTRPTRTRRVRCASTRPAQRAAPRAAIRTSPPSNCSSTPASSIAVLEPMCDAQLPQAEHVLKATYNDWLADVWLGDNNWHGRWRGAISVTAQDPTHAAREIERWAGHPYMAEVLITPQTRGIPFGSPHFDPMYEAAARNGLPVATHLMGQTPYELIPIFPVGNPAHWHDFFASWPLLYVSHLMSLVFDGAFDRHPDLKVVFVEGGFTWAMPSDVADGPDLGAAQGRSPACAAQAVRLRPRARAVHHAAARGGRRRRVPRVPRDDGPRRQHHVLDGLSALELRRAGLGDQAVPRRSARADHARQRDALYGLPSTVKSLLGGIAAR